MKKYLFLAMIIAMSAFSCTNVTDEITEVQEKKQTMNAMSSTTSVATSITVYYKPQDALWLFAPNNVYIHYNADNKGWTSLPGVIMTKESIYGPWNGYASITIEATNLRFCFNNGANQWDNNDSKDYVITAAGTYKIENKVITKIEETISGTATIYCDKAIPAFFGAGSSGILLGLSATIRKDGAFYSYSTVTSYVYNQPYIYLTELPSGSYTVSISQYKNARRYEGTSSFTISSSNKDVSTSMLVDSFEDVRIRISYYMQTYLGSRAVDGIPVDLYKDNVKIATSTIGTSKDGTDVTFRGLIAGSYKTVVGITNEYNNDIAGLKSDDVEYKALYTFEVSKSDVANTSMVMDIESVQALTSNVEVIAGTSGSFETLIIRGTVSNKANLIKNAMMTEENIYWLPATTNSYVLKLDTPGTYFVRGYVTNSSLFAHMTIVVKPTSYLKKYPQVYLRGTFNNWNTKAMTIIADNTWETVETFGSTTSERFKFDVYGNWSVNFGDTNKDGVADQNSSDIFVGANAQYKIRYNDLTNVYTVVKQ